MNNQLNPEKVFKLTFTILFILFSLNAFSQWENEIIDNGFDPKHKISTTDMYERAFLKLTNKYVDEEKTIKDVKITYDTIYKTKYSPEYPDGKIDTTINERKEFTYNWNKVYCINLSLIGGYHCEGTPEIEIVFVVDDVYKKHVFQGNTFTNRRGIELVKDVKSRAEFLDDFKKASLMKIRINETHCENGYYEFGMSGSTSAINFVSEL